jgi:hypothetical protein
MASPAAEGFNAASSRFGAALAQRGAAPCTAENMVALGRVVGNSHSVTRETLTDRLPKLQRPGILVREALATGLVIVRQHLPTSLPRVRTD